MKKIKFFSLALAALALGACSSDDEVTGGGSKDEGTNNYLAVNIVTANDGTRAYPGTDEYVDGSSDENTISSIRFYFFDGAGNPYRLKETGYNYVDQGSLSDATGDKTDITVEKIKTAVLVVDGQNDDFTSPASLVAIANADDLKLPSTDLSLSDLKTKIGDCSGNTSGKFVITNSVYGTTDDGIVTKIMPENLKNNRNDAETNPVQVYVERVLAKVMVSITINDDVELVDETNYYCVNPDANADDKRYVKIEGWGFGDYNGQSYLLKQFEDYSNLGFTPAVNEAYHRSYWATSVPFGESNSKQQTSYNGLNGALGGVLYTQENTPKNEESTPKTNTNLTKVIVKTKLYKKNTTNNTMEVAPRYIYFGREYSSENDVLEAIAGSYTNTYYYKNGSDYESIKPEHLEFIAEETGAKDYEVVAQVKSTAPTIYKKIISNTSDISYSEAGAKDNLNNNLKNNPAKIWNDGMAYYYIPIRHLATTETGAIGEYGVVRNHFYKVTVTKITGFGTPVYDANKDIIPTEVTDEDSYIAAQINVLGWRIVNNDNVELK